jgi:hypothetical protein
MPTHIDNATDHEIRLRDGRILNYAEYGDPDGFPSSAHTVASPVASMWPPLLPPPNSSGCG